jgi:hypothetical protein
LDFGKSPFFSFSKLKILEERKEKKRNTCVFVEKKQEKKGKTYYTVG